MQASGQSRGRKNSVTSASGRRLSTSWAMQLYRDKCIQIQASIFSALMDRGELRREDPLAVAAEFHGPMFMFIHTCDSFEEARPLIRAHVEQFQKNYAWRERA